MRVSRRGLALCTALGCVLTCSLLLSVPVGAEPPPYVGPGLLPIGPWVHSVEITRPDEPLYRGPSGAEARRGAAAKGARLPLYGAQGLRKERRRQRAQRGSEQRSPRH